MKPAQIKQGDEIFKIEKGNYILIFDPRQTSERELEVMFEMMRSDTIWDGIEIIAIPSFKPESFRLLKVEEAVKVKGE